MKSISRAGAVKFIRSTGGLFFSVKFIKRSTGEIREMHCRTGVRKYLAKNPSKPGLDFKANALIPVFDVDAPAPKKCDDGRLKGDYRSIPMEGITEIMINKVWYAVV